MERRDGGPLAGAVSAVVLGFTAVLVGYHAVRAAVLAALWIGGSL